MHEPSWTATARHADIVLPATTTLERDDIGGGAGRPATHRDAPGRAARSARRATTTTIFAELAERLGFGEAFTEGRTRAAMAASTSTSRPAARSPSGATTRRSSTSSGRRASWSAAPCPAMTHRSRRSAPTRGRAAADPERPDRALLRDDRRASATTTAPATRPGCRPSEWLGARPRFPLHLIANQPATRLHSQLDFGATSLASRSTGASRCASIPHDAAARGIADGDVVRVFNDRGACLAGAVLDDGVAPRRRPAVDRRLVRPRGPRGRAALRARQPERADRDAGTSRLAQGCTGQHTLVEIERFAGPLPPIRAFDPPRIAADY